MGSDWKKTWTKGKQAEKAFLGRLGQWTQKTSPCISTPLGLPLATRARVTIPGTTWRMGIRTAGFKWPKKPWRRSVDSVSSESISTKAPLPGGQIRIIDCPDGQVPIYLCWGCGQVGTNEVSFMPCVVCEWTDWRKRAPTLEEDQALWADLCQRDYSTVTVDEWKLLIDALHRTIRRGGG